MKQEPTSQRPEMPGGYLGTKLIAWSWDDVRLAESRNDWVTSVTPTGRPHARPVWGVWLDARLHFSSGSRIRSNLERGSAISVHLDSSDECVIPEDEARLLQEPTLSQRVATAYNEKYHWQMKARPGEFFEVLSRRVFDWLCEGSGRDGGALFSQTATRWSFDQVTGRRKGDRMHREERAPERWIQCRAREQKRQKRMEDELHMGDQTARATTAPLTRVLLLALLLAFTSPAAASEEQQAAPATRPEKAWSIEFTPYLWAVNMNMRLKGGPIDNTIGLDTVELLKAISGYAMADMRVQYERVGIMGDGMWSRLKTTEDRQILADTFEVEVQADMAWGTGAAFYEFRPTEQLSLSPYVGARWWRINTRLNLTASDGTPPPQSGEVLTRWADPVFGLLVDYDLTDKVVAKTGGDVGGGVSRVSWQVMLGAEYEVTSWFSADVMYRVMGVKYLPNGDELEIKLNGILFGFKFHY